MENPLISVIIPVYNVSGYLKQCLDSVIAQTYRNLEIILVDDGSTDGSGKICDEYAKQDKRIRVFHKENGGVSSARNTGLDQAGADYLCFVDADDVILSDYVMYLYKLLTIYQADLSICGYVKLVNINEYKDREKEYIRVYDKQAALKDMMYKHDITGYSCLKLYKKELLNDIYYDEELKVAEDFDFVYKYLLNTEKAVVGSKILYIYRQHEESCMHSDNWKKYERTWTIFNKRLSIIRRENPELTDAYITYLFIQALGFFAMSDGWRNADEFKRNLIKMTSKYSKTVMLNKESKIIYRLLGAGCFINGYLGCYICRFLSNSLKKFKIQFRKAV